VFHWEHTRSLHENRIRTVEACGARHTEADRSLAAFQSDFPLPECSVRDSRPAGCPVSDVLRWPWRSDRAGRAADKGRAMAESHQAMALPRAGAGITLMRRSAHRHDGDHRQPGTEIRRVDASRAISGRLLWWHAAASRREVSISPATSPGDRKDIEDRRLCAVISMRRTPAHWSAPDGPAR
jgi:hypothetical protein